MKRKKQNAGGRIEGAELLRALPYANRAMTITERGGGAVVAVPIRRPRWLVPPLSWILPFSSHRRVELDALGAAVLRMCDGKRTIESIIEKFAADHKLSFREAQLPVMQFLRQMTERGLVAIVAPERKTKAR